MSAAIMGCGTYGQVYLYYLKTSGVAVSCFLDDSPERFGSMVDDVPVIGSSLLIEELVTLGIDSFYCPIGANKIRVAFNERARRAGLRTPNFVHSTALVDSKLPLDGGVYVLPGAVVMPCSTIEKDVMISTSVTVAHHTRLEQGVFLSTGASIGAGLTLGKNVYVGMKATVVTGKVLNVEQDAFIGAGALVLENVVRGDVVAGIPARSLKLEAGQ